MSVKPTTKDSNETWERPEQTADVEIDTSDIPPLDSTFWDEAVLQMPVKKQSVTMRIDTDVLAWFKAQGKGYQTRINAILRSYMEAKKK